MKNLSAEYGRHTLYMTPFKVYSMDSAGAVFLYLYYPHVDNHKIWISFTTQEERANFFHSLIPEDEQGDFTLDKFNENDIVGCTGLAILRCGKVLYFVPAEWRKMVLFYP